MALNSRYLKAERKINITLVNWCDTADFFRSLCYIGLTTNVKWNTDNKTEIELNKEDLLVTGAGVIASAQFIPSGSVSVNVFSYYRSTHYSCNLRRQNNRKKIIDDNLIMLQKN